MTDKMFNTDLHKPIICFFLLTGILSLFSCEGDNKEFPNSNQPDKVSDVDPNILDSTSAINAKVGGKMFSIPSPIETMGLIKSTGQPFNEKLINDAGKVSEYNTTYGKSLAVGVYGADLGYSAIFKQNSLCLDLFASVEDLTADLGLSAAFDENLVKDFMDNAQDQQKLLQLITKAYRDGDNFLKENKQTDIAALILAGGWIESMYFATHFAQEGNKDLRRRIGEQKKSLISLIGLLEENKGEQGEKYRELVDKLVSLQKVFQKVESNYSYVAPETIPSKKLTIIKSNTSFNISEKNLSKIHDKIKSLRTNIVQ